MDNNTKLKKSIYYSLATSTICNAFVFSIIYKDLKSIDDKLDEINQMLQTEKLRIEQFEQRLDRVEQNLNSVDQNLEQVDPGLEKINQQLELKELEAKLNSILGMSAIIKPDAKIYSLNDFETPKIPFYNANDDMHRVIAAVILNDSEDNIKIASNQEEINIFINQGFTNIKGYLVLNKYSQNEYDYEGMYLADDLNLIYENNSRLILVRK